MRGLSLRDDKCAPSPSAFALLFEPHRRSAERDARIFSSCSTRDNVQLRSMGLPLATMLLGSLFSGSGAMAAQSLPAAVVSAPAPRVLGDWRGSVGVAIANSKPSFNPAAIDLGPAPANQTLGRMLLLLAPSPAQQQALAAELAGLQNSSSPNYHQWLTPQAFAHSYANNASDVAASQLASKARDSRWRRCLRASAGLSFPEPSRRWSRPSARRFTLSIETTKRRRQTSLLCRQPRDLRR